jgi:hypothetical protein
MEAHEQPFRLSVARARRSAQHDLAVQAIEARHIARTLRPFGILSRGALREAAGADRWHEGTFAGALAHAVSIGLIERCPLDFYRYADHDGRSRDSSRCAGAISNTRRAGRAETRQRRR